MLDQIKKNEMVVWYYRTSIKSAETPLNNNNGQSTCLSILNTIASQWNWPFKDYHFKYNIFKQLLKQITFFKEL